LNSAAEIQRPELRDICSIGDFQQAEDVLRLFSYPLISADGGDAEDVEFF